MNPILSAITLYIVVSIFTEGAEHSARLKILVIALCASFLQILTVQFAQGLGGVAIAFVSSLSLIWVGLTFWCQIERKPVLKIMGSYVLVSVLLSVVLSALTLLAA